MGGILVPSSGNPTLWLDVLVLLFILTFFAVTFAYRGKEPSLQKGRLKLLSGLLFASTFLFAGCDGLLTRALARRYSLTGVITHLVQHGGKSARSDFSVKDDSGDEVALHLDDDSKALRLGERVKVEWLLYNSRVMRVDILSGEDRGSHLNDGGKLNDFIDLGFGVFMLCLSLQGWRNNPIAIYTARSTSPIDGVVDTKSLLKLNER